MQILVVIQAPSLSHSCTPLDCLRSTRPSCWLWDHSVCKQSALSPERSAELCLTGVPPWSFGDVGFANMLACLSSPAVPGTSEVPGRHQAWMLGWGPSSLKAGQSALQVALGSSGLMSCHDLLLHAGSGSRSDPLPKHLPASMLQA